MMELNTYCIEIKYFYLELLAFYYILIGLGGELFWDKGISKHVFYSKHVNHWNTNTNQIGSNIYLPCKHTCQYIINLRQQFYKHKLDVKTLERIKELGLKGNSGAVGVIETRLEYDPQTREFINTYFEHCLNVIY